MNDRRQTYGFALMIVLVVIMVAGVVLAGMARKSSELALEAGRAQEQLQLKLGSQSCRDVLLGKAESFLKTPDRLGQPTCVASTTFRLGGMDFEMIFSDEQAKANVNLLVKRLGDVQAEQAIRSVQADLPRNLLVELKPNKVQDSTGRIAAAPYGSYDQIFVFKHPSELLDARAPELSPIGRVTCWGSGRLNFRRAPLAVMREVLGDLVTEGQLAEVIRLREGNPNRSTSDALKAMDLPKESIPKVQDLLTDTSGCRSLWIIAHGKSRNWYRLYVSQGEGKVANSGNRFFEW